ncbi:Uncharacterised protein [Mycobacteroides abscessus subsp. abscessus]|nr:Uncharacterised protein [Mycobacteroides abscessus subsp. abscessus]SKW44884.1 Uncharacterised protein [Mycobacteroides abscessus subsp. abscessus]
MAIHVTASNTANTIGPTASLIHFHTSPKLLRYVSTCCLRSVYQTIILRSDIHLGLPTSRLDAALSSSTTHRACRYTATNCVQDGSFSEYLVSAPRARNASRIAR